MKRMVEKVVGFLKREWFLLVMLVIIALIIFVFEWMR